MLIKTEKLYRNTLLNIQKYIFISTKKTRIYKLTIRVIQYILDIDIQKQIQIKSHPHIYTNDREVHEGSRKTKDKHLNLE